MSGPDTSRILSSLRLHLAALYGSRLRGLYVFGSFARGDSHPDSDLDVLVVLDRTDAYAEEIRRTGGIFWSLSLEAETSIVPVFVAESDWTAAATAFLANVRREARAA
jgi:uncharacterized protein